MADEQGNKTRYAVLVKAEPDEPDDPEAWEFVGFVEAGTADKAKGHFAEANERPGEYVATPARSWLPSPVTLERTPRAIVGKTA